MAVNVRVEMRKMYPNSSREERDRAFQGLMKAFKKACDTSGILKLHKKYESFERNTDIRRRKQKNKEMMLANINEEKMDGASQ